MIVLFSFKKRFVPRIESGIKRMTIRAVRKRMPAVGDDLRLSFGPRFKPRLIGWATALEVVPVTLQFSHGAPHLNPGYSLALGGAGPQSRLSVPMDEFARRDGFDDWNDLERFWRETHGLQTISFSGFLTFWGDTFRKDAP